MLWEERNLPWPVGKTWSHSPHFNATGVSSGCWKHSDIKSEVVFLLVDPRLPHTHLLKLILLQPKSVGTLAWKVSCVSISIKGHEEGEQRQAVRLKPSGSPGGGDSPFTPTFYGPLRNTAVI